MSPRPAHAKTHRFIEILALMTLLTPVIDVGASLPLEVTPAIVPLLAALVVALALVFRPLRKVSWLAILASGLLGVVLRPHPNGMLLILFGAYLVFDSGWAFRRTLAMATLSTLVVGAQGLSLALSPSSVTDVIRWVLIDALLIVLIVTFRRDLFVPALDGRPVLNLFDLPLNERERQIVHLVWGGETPKEIAGFLGANDATVRKCLSQIYAKMQVPGLKELSHLVHTHRVVWEEPSQLSR